MSKSKYDNNFKSEVIDNGYLKAVITKKKELYHQDKELVLKCQFEGKEYIDTHITNAWSYYYHEHINISTFDCSIRLIESRSRKYSKAKKKIEKIVKGYKEPIFITLTFTDNVLNNTSAETRRRYVARYLKEHCKDYVANIDYSPDKNREHYHAVIGQRIDFNKWPYGFGFAEKIRIQDNNAKRISSYIVKLTAHAFKVNITRLIYSRNNV